MSKSKGGINSLAHVLQNRMSTVMNSNMKNVCDIGTVQPDGSLMLRMFPIPIPAGQYLVCRSLTFGNAQSDFVQTETGGDPQHTHSVKLPEMMQSLKQGDNVFCCWVDNDVIVVDVLG